MCTISRKINKVMCYTLHLLKNGLEYNKKIHLKSFPLTGYKVNVNKKFLWLTLTSIGLILCFKIRR